MSINLKSYKINLIIKQKWQSIEVFYEENLIGSVCCLITISTVFVEKEKHFMDKKINSYLNLLSTFHKKYKYQIGKHALPSNLNEAIPNDIKQ